MMNVSLAHQPITLIGMMGAGKSTLSKGLAKALARPFIDIDSEIERTSSMAIRSVFARQGEAYFRQLESEALSLVLAQASGCIISTGGGIVLAEANRTMLQQKSLCLYIDVPVSVLSERLKADQLRPLLDEGNHHQVLSKLHQERHQLYLDTAHHHIPLGDDSIEHNVAAILDTINLSPS